MDAMTRNASTAWNEEKTSEQALFRTPLAKRVSRLHRAPLSVSWTESGQRGISIAMSTNVYVQIDSRTYAQCKFLGLSILQGGS